MNPTTIEACARAAHEANRAYSRSLDDFSHAAWDDAPEWQRQSALLGVKRALEGITPEQMHQAWLQMKQSDGWVYGPVKDGETKHHPCMVPYAELPESQRRKDALFLSIVSAMARALEPEHA